MRLSPKEAQAFSLASVLRQMTADALYPGSSFEAEVLQDVAASHGRSFDPGRVAIPLALLATRDMTVAGASGSQYLVGTDTAAPADVLRPWSVTARAGVTILPGLKADTVVPQTSAPTTGYWLDTEAAPITESQPAIGAVSMQPKIGAGYVEYTRLLRLQSEVEALLRRDLLRTVGTLLDVAVMAGTGADGQPAGLYTISGTNPQDGTGLTWDDALAMEEACANANGEPSAWIGTTGVRRLLKGREKAAGSGFIWDADNLAGRPAYATTAAPANSLTCGPWEQIAVGVWGPGPEISINPYADFKTGKYSMRVILPCDVAVMQPGAFTLSNNVS